MTLIKIEKEVHFQTYFSCHIQARETQGSGSGWGGLDLFRPRGAIGRGPEGP
jgi:hypothetical protein